MFITIPNYPGAKQQLYLKYNSPRIKKYCDLLDFESNDDRLNINKVETIV